MHEFILVLRKGNVNSGRNQRRDALPATHEEWTKEIANSVWHIAPVPPGYINHPCPFPEEIPYRLMKSCILTKVTQSWIHSMGSGQTTKVASHFKRRYVGMDIIEDYVKLG